MRERKGNERYLTSLIVTHTTITQKLINTADNRRPDCSRRPRQMLSCNKLHKPDPCQIDLGTGPSSTLEAINLTLRHPTNDFQRSFGIHSLPTFGRTIQPEPVQENLLQLSQGSLVALHVTGIIGRPISIHWRFPQRSLGSFNFISKRTQCHRIQQGSQMRQFLQKQGRRPTHTAIQMRCSKHANLRVLQKGRLINHKRFTRPHIIEAMLLKHRTKFRTIVHRIVSDIIRGAPSSW
mmetsp:Transcript_6211/g.9063  ORF Transcript_6211/g.9063 Transcript_6211/m.9063 type:complete len:236 (+) Transcript_6211:483-1190(+)